MSFSRPKAYWYERRRQKQRLGVVPWGKFDGSAGQTPDIPGQAYVIDGGGNYVVNSAGAYVTVPS